MNACARDAYVVVEFPAGARHFTGEMAEELAKLAESGTIRILDVLILRKDADGSGEPLEIDDLRAIEAGIAEILAEGNGRIPIQAHRGLARGRRDRRSLTCLCDPHEQHAVASSADRSPARRPSSAPPPSSPTASTVVRTAARTDATDADHRERVEVSPNDEREAIRHSHQSKGTS